MDKKLGEFQKAIEIESHILADLEGSNLPDEFKNYLMEVAEVFSQDKSKLEKTINFTKEGQVTKAFIEFREFLNNFPYDGMKKLYNYCAENLILSERQLEKFHEALEVFESESSDLRQDLLRYALKIGEERVREGKHHVYVEKKGIEKAYSLTKTYQKQKGKECAGVFKYEPETHRTFLKDFRGLSRKESSYDEEMVNYDDNFREELKDVSINKYMLLHSHPQIGNEMGSIAYRPSESDIKFFRNHNSQISIICPLLPDFLEANVGMSAISLKSEGFEFLPIYIVNRDKEVTEKYPSVKLYNNLLYLLSTADLGDQNTGQSMGTIQFMLGQEMMQELYKM